MGVADKMEAELEIYKEPWLVTHLHSIRRRIYTKITDLETTVCTDKEPIPFEERTSRSQRKISKNQTWGKAFTCSWFHFTGSIPEEVKSKHIVLIINIDGEGLLVSENNEPVSAITSRISFVERLQSTRGKKVIDFTGCSKGGERIDVWLEGGFNGKIVLPFGKSHFKKAIAAVCRDDIKKLYYDYLALSYALNATNDTVKRKEICCALKAAYGVLCSYKEEEVKKASKLLNSVLSKTNTAKQLSFAAIGHSHLDLAWLWPIRETRRKAARTFTIALNNIEKYPGYVYGASQPQQFAWVKQDYPYVYNRVKEAVKNVLVTLFFIMIAVVAFSILYIIWGQIVDFLQGLKGEVMYRAFK
jgi:alpha-mannosidase